MSDKKRNISLNQTDDTEESIWFRRRMNRVFRERGGVKDVPHPEVDTAYERLRSRFVRLVLAVGNKIKSLFKGKNT